MPSLLKHNPKSAWTQRLKLLCATLKDRHEIENIVAWGRAISSYNTYADIYGAFFALDNDRLEVAEISKKLIGDNQETINETDDCNNFWLALAKTQWEIIRLDKDIFD